MKEFTLFFAVTVLGVVIDIAIAYALHETLGVPLVVAATAGFVIAASANYVMHQKWSFQSGPRGLSFARAVKYAAVAGTTLAARVALVAVLASAFEGRFPLAILICGAGVSFFVNFGLSKLFVFSDAPSRGSAS